MRELRTVTCASQRSYRVSLGYDILAGDNPRLAELIGHRRTLLVTTPSVHRLYGPQMLTYLKRHGLASAVQVLCCSEFTKTVETVLQICASAQAFEVDRKGLLIGFGGGVCTDLVTVAASWIRRGIGHARVPTTLVGQVDAAIGVKGAVNFGGKKNYLGCYFAPEAVLIDPTFLRTLPRSALRCGLAEIVKIALVKGGDLFRLVESAHPTLVDTGFAEPAEVINKILSLAITRMLDELEPNIYENVTYRRLVDMGHTFSPILESLSAFTISHGEAVAVDMALSASIARQHGYLGSFDYERIMNVLQSIGLPVWSPLLTLDTADRALEEARRHRGGQVNLVVPTAIGEATFLDFAICETRLALRRAIEGLRDSYTATITPDFRTTAASLTPTLQPSDG